MVILLTSDRVVVTCGSATEKPLYSYGTGVFLFMSEIKKHFLSYDEQIDLLMQKKLSIKNDEIAKSELKRYSYYSLITGYKDIFKIAKNGDYKSDASFEGIINLYKFDDYMREIFLHEFIHIEKHIKSLYSYSFCELYGDKQNDYLDANNYNYSKYQTDVNNFISILNGIIRHSSRYKYVHHNKTKYKNVPLWVIMQTLTFGNLSKMYNFSNQKLQSQVAKEFPSIYPHQLSSMLNVLSKFRNVCAHGERLYNYKTKKSIKKLDVYNEISEYNPKSKNDLFTVLICLKYLLPTFNYENFLNLLNTAITRLNSDIGESYTKLVLEGMGFPDNWKDIAAIPIN